MKTRILTAVLFAAALVPVSASAHSRSIDIDTGDLNLSTQAGREMLDARIDGAVRKVCRSGQRGIAGRLEMQACAADVRSAVQPQIELAMADARGAHLAGLTVDPEA
ncbi:UrcA family protein [Erythrobacter sp. YJ-T3-07]|uniref:UrcA family protein n=1 Tax=Erythrobacter sp. YJ-T3-07 TaxID=2793063 RepID=UPI0018D49973|nr:UrcA family protein [Erythrobacter sp. YJ-T3-07]MBH1944346.1 UrcA family protein [Erythrobacter sp. YJ-T3-07]